MAYIGRQPTVGNFQICDAISVVNNQAAYTMQVASVNVIPETANHMIVSLNGVIQKPGSSYTVSGSTITFSSNLVTGDVIDFIQILGSVLDIGTPSDGTVTESKIGSNAVTTAKITDANVTSAKMFSGFANGVTQADVWRYTASTQQPSGLLNSNFERADDASSGTIGSAMTFSSGTWSFPITGIYLINASVGFNFANQADNNANLVIGITNNNSSYDDVAIIFSGSNSGSGFSRFSQYGHAIVDVTDTAQVKIQITANSFESDSYLEGSTDRNDTAFSFIRLGDT